MHIKICCVTKDKSHITRYQELQHFKQDQKCVISDYSENMKASIASLQNQSFSAIKSIIPCSSKSITLSHDTNSFVITGCSSVSNVTTQSNSRIYQVVHLFLELMAIIKK